MRGTEATHRCISLTREASVARIVVDHPPVNALGRACLEELEQSVAHVARDRALRVLVVAGIPGIFSAGADIKEYVGLSADEALANFAIVHRALLLIEEMPKVVVAAITGHAIGGGLELALACDLRVCVDTATLALPELDMGWVPCWGALRRLPRVVGEGKARWMIITGERLSAHQAQTIGLVDVVVTPEELDSVVDQIAASAVRKSPHAVGVLKRLLPTLAGSGPLEDREAELNATAALLHTEELRKGREAFLTGGRR